MIGIVFLLKYVPKEYPYDFGYKDMEEEVGPVESKCPDRILDLLTPTKHPYALRWRQRCREYNEETRRISKLKKQVGKILVPQWSQSITVNGQEYDRFKLDIWPGKRTLICRPFKVGSTVPSSPYRASRPLLSKLRVKEEKP